MDFAYVMTLHWPPPWDIRVETHGVYTPAPGDTRDRVRDLIRQQVIAKAVDKYPRIASSGSGPVTVFWSLESDTLT